LRAGEIPSRVNGIHRWASGLGDVSVLAGSGRDSNARNAKTAQAASIALVYDLRLGANSDKMLSFAAPTGDTPAEW